MSLFLGKIHHWLYHKILWTERTEQEIIRWAAGQGLPAEEWARASMEKYGEPTGGQPLEEIIDTSNIHGWLQDRIKSAELRQASLVTAILSDDPNRKDALLEIFQKQGQEAAKKHSTRPDTPEGMFNALNDYVLEGMPCDRASEVVATNDKEYTWQTTTCLHQPYWEEVMGNVQNYYDLRNAWISSFVKTLNPDFSYQFANGRYTIEDNTNA